MTLLAYADGVDTPAVDPAELAADPEVLIGWVPGEREWLKRSSFRGRTFMAGYGTAEPVADGRLRYVPVRLSAVAVVLAAQPLDVAVVGAVWRGSDLAYASSVGWAPTAVAHARQVVVEVLDGAPDLGAPLVDADVSAIVPGVADRTTSPRPPDDIERAIGRAVAALVPDGATVQVGPGGIAEAILATLDRPVGVWSGLVTDGVAALAERGLLRGRAVAAYAWGGAPLAALAATGRLRLAPVSETHDLTAVSAIPRFVACNTALQVGLDGSVNVERVRGRLVAGVGGHADFCAAGARSVGGASIIALRSTDSRGCSTIVPSVDTVSTPRCDVSIVVTEHGVADLRGADDDERHRLIRAIAAPAHRDALP